MFAKNTLSLETYTIRINRIYFYQGIFIFKISGND